MRPLPLLTLLTLIVIAALLAALTLGSLNLDPAAVVKSLTGSGDPLTDSVLFELRLPRALAALAVGALLALAGVQMQVLLGNPLADPYVLGVSGGAAVGALFAIMRGMAPWLQNGEAVFGAFASMVLVFGLARGYPPRISSSLVHITFTGFCIALATWAASFTK